MPYPICHHFLRSYLLMGISGMIKYASAEGGDPMRVVSCGMILGIASLAVTSCVPPADWVCSADEPCPQGKICVSPHDLPEGSVEQTTVPACFKLCENSSGCTGSRACLFIEEADETGLCVFFDEDCAASDCPEGFYCDGEAICQKYPAATNCQNDVKDGAETDVDCGGCTARRVRPAKSARTPSTA